MQDGSRATVHGDAARPQARAVQGRESERSAGGLGNMSVARHFQQGAPGAAFGGAPLGNQQELGRARVQAKCAECENQSRRMNVQAKCTTCASGERAARDPAVVPTAVQGVSSASSRLPHLDRIQSAFGRHDVSHVRAAVGGDAGHAAEQLGAAAYTVGDRIAFRAEPDVRLAAHEAAHVVQQRSGLKLAGDVGTPGDRYERAADAVADAVADGRPADHLLDQASTEAPSSPKVQMQWAHTQHPGMPAYPTQPQPPGGNCDQRGISALMTEVVELQGNPYFQPSRWIDSALYCIGHDGWFVHARFGKLASGVLKVRAVPLPTAMPSGSTATPSLNYETVDDKQFLDLHHPSFPGGGANYPPRLYVKVDGGSSKVTGRISFSPGGFAVMSMGVRAWLGGFAWEELLGFRGLTNVNGHVGVNSLDNGKLDFTLPGFDFKLDDETTEGGMVVDGEDSIGGTGSFEVHDAAETFTAAANIEGDGIAPGKMTLRKVAERISGSGSYGLTLAPKDMFGGSFSGSIKGSFAGGRLTLTGNARYSSKRLKGNVTVMLAPRAVAWDHVLARLPYGAANSPTVSTGAATASGYAVVGWGTVDFALNEWLTGSVSAVVDPEGYITSFGVLRPTKQFRFLTDKEALSKRFDIAHLDGSVTLWSAIPVIKVASVDGVASADIWAQGRVGPGLVYDLEVAGTFSTRPGSVFEASATGKINLSAWAQVKAELEGALAVKLGVPVFNVSAGKLGIKGVGTATVRAYAEIAPKFERIAGSSGPDSADYRISGTLDAAGALDFGLSGEIFIDVAGHRVWTVNLGSYEWRIGSLGMKAAISHVIGSHAPIDLSLESADFDDSKFQTEISDLANKDGAKNAGEHDTELAQDPKTKAPATPEDPTLAMHSFTMNGVPHLLWVAHEPAAVLMMASGGAGRLRDKLAAEDKLIEKQKAAQSGAAAEELADKQAQVRSIGGEARATEHRLDDLQSESKQAGDVAGISEIADRINTYGTEFEEGNLAEAAPPPASAGPDIDDDQRWIIKTKADLDAVRAIAPDVDSPPENVDIDDWKAYAGKYFPRRLKELEADFANGKGAAHRGPLTWDGYLKSEAKLGPVRGQKKFQPELRNEILADNPDLDPKNVEIDVGLSPTRRGVPKGPFYADVVVEDPANKQVEVYSTKVHNVAAARVSRKTDIQIQKWIEARMAEDVDEAADKYGHEVEFRRPRQSPKGDGKAGDPGDPKHPLFEKTMYVSRVNLVWKYSSDLIPEDLLQFIEVTGENYGVKARKGRKVEVRFKFSPQP